MSIKLKNSSISDAIALLPRFMAGAFTSVNYWTTLQGGGTCAYGDRICNIAGLPVTNITWNQACYARLWYKHGGYLANQERTLLLRTDKLKDDGYIQALQWLYDMHPEYLLKGHDKAEAGYVIIPDWKQHHGNNFARFIILIRNLSEKHDWKQAQYWHSEGFSPELSLNLAMLFRAELGDGSIYPHGTGHSAFEPRDTVSALSWAKVKARLLNGGFTRNNPNCTDRTYRWQLGKADAESLKSNDAERDPTVTTLFKALSRKEEQWGQTQYTWRLDKVTEFLKKELLA